MLDTIGRQLAKKMFINPILVIGAGRSGTSILLQSLGKHSAIVSADRESPFIPYLGYLVHPFEFRWNKDYHSSSLNLPTEYVYQSIQRLCFESVFGERYGLKNLPRLSDGFLALLKKSHWCAKTFPNQIEAMGLVKLYPSIRFIYIFRNGCDVVNSRSQFKGMSKGSFSEHCENWAKHVEKFHYLFDMDQAIQIRHEDLVKDGEKLFRRLFNFLNLEYEDGPLNFTKTTHIHPLDKRTQQNVDVSQIMKERRRVYEDWTSQQKDVFRSICDDGMEKLGYEIPFDSAVLQEE